MIQSLQSLRGIFAIMVFLSHSVIAPDGHRAFYAGGTMGVEFFIVLSGFVMCAGYGKAATSPGFDFRRFMLRRLIRLWPLHLGCLALWMTVHRHGLSGIIPDLSVNALMLQPWIPIDKYYYSGNTPSWCLGVFIFLYALFPWLVRQLTRNPRRFISVFSGLWGTYILYLIAIPSVPAVSEETEVWMTRIFPPLRLLDFTLGMLLWKCYTYLHQGNMHMKMQTLGTATKTSVEAVPLVFLAAASVAFYHLPIKWESTAIWWLPAAATVIVYALLDNEGGLISRVLASRPLIAFGNASFVFYLFHQIGINLCNRLYYEIGFTAGPAWRLVTTLAIIIVLNTLISRYIDTPVGNSLKRRLTAKK